MRKIIIALMALVCNMFLFSCTSDTVTEEEILYENQATEGDDGQVNPPPPPPGIGD